MEEIWKGIDGLEDRYEISNLGNLRSVPRFVNAVKLNCRPISGKLLKTSYTDSSKRYKLAPLWDGKKSARKLVHRLVAKAFVTNPNNKPFVNHIDGNPLNNRFDNLEWCTQKENMQHAVRTGLMGGEKNHSAKLKESQVKIIKRLLLDGNTTVRKIAEDFKVHTRIIYFIKLGVSWKTVAPA